MKPVALVDQWRNTALSLSAYGADSHAAALNRCAKELEEALTEADDATVNLTQAAELSGYSADHLGKLVREGKIPNAGRENAPRIRVGDVPKKATAVVPLRVASADNQFSARRIAESVTTRRKRRA